MLVRFFARSSHQRVHRLVELNGKIALIFFVQVYGQPLILRRIHKSGKGAQEGGILHTSTSKVK